MVPVLNFGSAAGHTAAVTGALGSIAGDALLAGAGALAGAIGGPAGGVIGAVAGAVEEPSDTLPFDDDMGADADYDRVYEFALKKELCTKELRMLDRDVEAHRSWVGVASVPDASASLNLSAGLSLGGGLSSGLSGGLSGGLGAVVGATFDVDAPTIPAAMLREEIYQEDLAVWQDVAVSGAGPSVSLSASFSVGSGPGVSAAVQAHAGSGAIRPPAISEEAVRAKRLGMELARARRGTCRPQGQKSLPATRGLATDSHSAAIPSRCSTASTR